MQSIIADSNVRPNRFAPDRASLFGELAIIATAHTMSRPKNHNVCGIESSVSASSARETGEIAT
jgi:hypothetical protein